MHRLPWQAISPTQANGHTTGVVRVRSLTVVVMRHCFDDLAETESCQSL